MKSKEKTNPLAVIGRELTLAEKTEERARKQRRHATIVAIATALSAFDLNENDAGFEGEMNTTAMKIATAIVDGKVKGVRAIIAPEPEAPLFKEIKK